MNKPIPTCRDPWARWAKIILAIAVCATLLALAGCAKDDTDPDGGRSGMTPYTDALTGCQYLVVKGVYSRAMYPRMDRDGKQVCK